MKPNLLRITTVALSLEVLLSGQAEFMAQNGFKVSLASAGKLSSKPDDSSGDILHYSIPMVRKMAPFRDLYAFFRLLLLMIRIKPDIVHTHTPKAGLLGMLAAKLLGVPIRIHTIGGLPMMTAKGWEYTLLSLLEKLTCWGAMYVWPNSKSLFDYITEKGLCPKQKLDIIANGSSNGINFKSFSKTQVRKTTLTDIKHHINYQEDKCYLLAVGRIVKDKGINDLVAAFEQLHSQMPHLRLLLVGPIEKIRSAEKLSATTLKAIQNHTAIQHISWTTEIASYLSLANLLIHASYREGLPNVLLQAAAMGCPIVCSDIGGNTDIVTHQKTGLTYATGDVQHLVDTVIYALRNPKDTNKRARQLKTIVKDSFARKRLQTALLERYNQLLEQKLP